MQEFVEKIDRHFGKLYEELSRAVMRMADIERRIDNSLRHGKVTDVDTKKQLFRMEVAKQDGEPVKSPWIPYGQTAGDYKHHRPPTKGQQMSIFAPNGEMRQALALPMTWSDQNKSPSEKEDEHVTTYGKKYRLREKQDLRAFTLDKTKTVFKPDTITTTVNGGNTPKGENGTDAGDDDQNDQEDQGSTIKQEEGKITASVKETSQVIDENSITQKAAQTLVFEAEQSITIKAGQMIMLQVGSSTILIQDGRVVVTADLVATDGITKLGIEDAQIPVMLESGPASKVFGI